MYGTPAKSLSTEAPVLPVEAPDPRNRRVVITNEGFRCRTVDILLRVEDGWVDPTTLARWIGADLKFLLRAAAEGTLDAAVTEGSELPLLRVRDEQRLRKMLSKYKDEIRRSSIVAQIQKGKKRG